MVSKRAVVTGLVQGVGFRCSTVRRAQRLGLTGWVRNLPGGGVEAVADGDAGSVAQFVQWLHEGPPGALVERVEVSDSEPSGERGFAVRW